MSFDLAAFDLDEAPAKPADFMAWYDQQTDWKAEFDYNDPSRLTPPLRAWFEEIRLTFPPMNGPLASDDDDDPHVTDYSLGQGFIYMSLAPSVVDEAIQLANELATKHLVGLFDPQTGNSYVPKPNEPG